MRKKARDRTREKSGKIVVSKNGPYLVTGGLPLRQEIAEVGGSGDPETWIKGKRYPVGEEYRLCRCGRSENHPFCDSTHLLVRFNGTETASRRPYDRQAEDTEGPGIDLKDVESLCASARFCFPKGGTWELTMGSDDPEKRKTAVQQAGNCPSGRLVACSKRTGRSIEPRFKPSISLIEDPQAEASGPVWVKGGVTVESEDGSTYETRNRVTLCRCGRSKSKPFCDGTHIKVKFNDGDESVNR